MTVFLNSKDSLEDMRNRIASFFENGSFIRHPHKNYIYISYSRDDEEVVFPDVIKWLEQGYNICLGNLEGENKEGGWIEDVKGCLQSHFCKGVVCYETNNYIHDPKTLIELLTLKSRETKAILSGEQIHIDVIMPEDVNVDIPEKELSDYKDRMETMKQGVSGENFEDDYAEEYKCMVELLEEWYAIMTDYQKRGIQVVYPESEDIAKTLRIAYKRNNYYSFYRVISYVITNWFKTTDLTGNTKGDAKNIYKRFDNLRVFNSKRSKVAMNPEPVELVVEKLVDRLKKSSYGNGEEVTVIMENNKYIIRFRENFNNVVSKNFDPRVHELSIDNNQVIVDNSTVYNLPVMNYNWVSATLPMTVYTRDWDYDSGQQVDRYEEVTGYKMPLYKDCEGMVYGFVVSQDCYEQKSDDYKRFVLPYYGLLEIMDIPIDESKQVNLKMGYGDMALAPLLRKSTGEKISFLYVGGENKFEIGPYDTVITDYNINETFVKEGTPLEGYDYIENEYTHSDWNYNEFFNPSFEFMETDLSFKKMSAVMDQLMEDESKDFYKILLDVQGEPKKLFEPLISHFERLNKMMPSLGKVNVMYSQRLCVYIYDDAKDASINIEYNTDATSGRMKLHNVNGNWRIITERMGYPVAGELWRAVIDGIYGIENLIILEKYGKVLCFNKKETGEYYAVCEDMEPPFAFLKDTRFGPVNDITKCEIDYVESTEQYFIFSSGNYEIHFGLYDTIVKERQAGKGLLYPATRVVFERPYSEEEGYQFLFDMGYLRKAEDEQQN